MTSVAPPAPAPTSSVCSADGRPKGWSATFGGSYSWLDNKGEAAERNPDRILNATLTFSYLRPISERCPLASWGKRLHGGSLWGNIYKVASVKYPYGVMPDVIFADIITKTCNAMAKSMKTLPDKDKAFPNPAIPSLCYIKNVVKDPRIIIGDYTYYDDPEGADRFEEHVTHHYGFLGDRLVIGRFCAIAKGVEFVMNGANHRMDCATTYPFYIMGGDWGSMIAPVKEELPLKGDTVVGNDVWIGQNVTIMPGVHIGDGAIVGANSTVASDVPPYCVAVGNPARVVRRRFDDETIGLLEKLRWWDKPIEEIDRLMPLLTTPDKQALKASLRALTTAKGKEGG